MAQTAVWIERRPLSALSPEGPIGFAVAALILRANKVAPPAAQPRPAPVRLCRRPPRTAFAACARERYCI